MLAYPLNIVSSANLIIILSGISMLPFSFTQGGSQISHENNKIKSCTGCTSFADFLFCVLLTCTLQMSRGCSEDSVHGFPGSQNAFIKTSLLFFSWKTGSDVNVPRRHCEGWVGSLWCPWHSEHPPDACSYLQDWVPWTADFIIRWFWGLQWVCGQTLYRGTVVLWI